MKLCVGTSKGIVILDPARGGAPLMVLAEPAPVWCMAQDAGDPNLIFAGSNAHSAANLAGGSRNRGVLSRSHDGGRTWTDISANLNADEEVWALGAPPGRAGELFVGTSHARLFHTVNGGRSFRECAAFTRVPGRERWSFPPPPHIPHIRSISFDPTNPETMYLGVEEGGVMRSRDRGESFEVLNRDIYTDIHTIAVDPHDWRRLYATTGNGFYLSEDSGNSWGHVTSGLSRSYTVPLLVDFGADGKIYTAAAAAPPPSWSRGSAGADALCFSSSDGGRSFQTIAASPGPTRGMVMQLRPDPTGEAVCFGVISDGTVIRLGADAKGVSTISDRLPPAYDLVTTP